jgi:hypothetical protein
MPGVFSSRAAPANRREPKKFEDYFEAAAEAAAAFFSALCSVFAFLAGAEAASAAKAPTAKVEMIRAARSLVILRYLR